MNQSSNENVLFSEGPTLRKHLLFIVIGERIRRMMNLVDITTSLDFNALWNAADYMAETFIFGLKGQDAS